MFDANQWWEASLDALDEEGGNDFRVNGDEFCGSFLFFNFFFSISSMFFFQNFHYSFMFLFSFKTKIINAHHRRSRPRNLSTILYQITRVGIYVTGCIHRRSVWSNIIHPEPSPTHEIVQPEGKK